MPLALPSKRGRTLRGEGAAGGREDRDPRGSAGVTDGAGALFRGPSVSGWNTPRLLPPFPAGPVALPGCPPHRSGTCLVTPQPAVRSRLR